jgi:hypothetical protein
MPDFNVRSDSVNVEQIMEQIRARIREKRGVDYTEQQIRELAAVKLEKFLDPRSVRSDLLDQFRKGQSAHQPPERPNFAFEDATLFESHRAPIRWIRRMLAPFLKMLFNPNPLIQALHIQSRLNTINGERESAHWATEQLFYELLHNLVVETTRTAIEVKNLKMRVESISSRLEFNERRARALEGVVVYKAPETEERPAQRPSSQPPRQPSPPAHRQERYTPPPQVHNAPPQAAATSQTPPAAAVSPLAPQSGSGQPQEQGPGTGVPGEGPGQRSRRRRRRRGRRGGGSASAIMGAPGAPAMAAPADAGESGEPADPIDAMDAMEDDGSPEPDEPQPHAARQSEQPSAEPSAAHVPVESAVQAPEPQRVDAPAAAPDRPSESGVAAPEPARPAAPEHGDPDPQ